MIITHNLQYPPNPYGSTSYWSIGTQLSSNAGVPAGCPFSYATQIGRFDTRIASISNWFPSRLNSLTLLEVSGWFAVNDSTKTNLCSMGIRYGTAYSNTAPNGYISSSFISFSPSDYQTWKYFKVIIQGVIPLNGTENATININSNNDGTGTNWWMAGLSVSKLQ